MDECDIGFKNPDKQAPREGFEFHRRNKVRADCSTNDLALLFSEIAAELGMPDDLPVPPKGLPGFNYRPNIEVMDLIRLGVRYAMALANGEHRACWLRFQEMEAALRRARDEGILNERDAESNRRAEWARQHSADTERRYQEAKVYFIQAETGHIKIGMATDPNSRLRSLQTSHPAKLTLLCVTSGGKERETAYHREFAEHRREGEWFAPHPDILAEIERLQGEPQ